MNYSVRIEQLQQQMGAQGISFSVIAPTDNMRYLTGWAEGGHERLIALFIPAIGEPTFVVPEMNVPQALSNGAGITNVVGWKDDVGWGAWYEAFVRSQGAASPVIAIDEELLSSHLLAMIHLIPDCGFIGLSKVITPLRQTKSANELELMRESARITDGVYDSVVECLEEGMSETDFAGIIERAYARVGLKPAFCIVAFGPNSAIPHHSSGDSKLKKGDLVIIDIGCQYNGYASDITRTVAFGRPEPEAFLVYDIVYKAHMEAMTHGAPGTLAQDVDFAARNVIVAAGYGEYFNHRLGHGIGLSTHEPPNFVKGDTSVLQPGMCFSDEPGIYLPGRFGVRIENVVSVTESGLVSLNRSPSPSLIVIGD